jgi:hypothetical protein
MSDLDRLLTEPTPPPEEPPPDTGSKTFWGSKYASDVVSQTKTKTQPKTGASPAVVAGAIFVAVAAILGGLWWFMNPGQPPSAPEQIVPEQIDNTFRPEEGTTNPPDNTPLNIEPDEPDNAPPPLPDVPPEKPGPVSVNDDYRNIKSGQFLKIPRARGLLVNDSPSPEGSTQVVAVRVNGAETSVSASGTVFQTEQNGTVKLKPDGSFEYTSPQAPFAGEDRFEYRAVDGDSSPGNWATVTFDVSAPEEPPAQTPPPSTQPPRQHQPPPAPEALNEMRAALANCGTFFCRDNVRKKYCVGSWKSVPECRQGPTL